MFQNRADAKWRFVDAILEETRRELHAHWCDQHRADVFIDNLITAIQEFTDAQMTNFLEEQYGSDY